MMVKAIVATAYDGAIGCRGAIPWDGDAPRDMKYFMDTTRNSVIIMGRVTADSLKLPFKTRRSIIVTTKINETLERYGHHSDVVGSLEDALHRAEDLVTIPTVTVHGSPTFTAVTASSTQTVKDIFIIGKCAFQERHAA